MLESLFNKVADHQTWNFIKRRSQHRRFPVNIAKFLKTAFFYRIPLLAASEYTWQTFVGYVLRADNLVKRLLMKVKVYLPILLFTFCVAVVHIIWVEVSKLELDNLQRTFIVVNFNHAGITVTFTQQ